jgi:fluoroquinolone transport system permease protein
MRTFRSVALIDVAASRRDAIPVLIVGSIPLLALQPRLLGWVLDDRVSAQLLAELRLAATLLVIVLHIPFMLSAVSGLTMAEARDDGVVPTLAVTPPGLSSVLTARLALPAAVAVTGVPAGVAIGGVAPASGWSGLVPVAVAAAAVCVLISLAMTLWARTKVEAVALVKVLGLPVHAGVALVWVEGLGRVPISVLPGAWPAHAFLSDSMWLAWAAAGSAVLVAAAALAWASSRFDRKLLSLD